MTIRSSFLVIRAFFNRPNVINCKFACTCLFISLIFSNELTLIGTA